MEDTEIKLRTTIKKSIEKIFDLRKNKRKFIPGKTWVQYAGGVFDDREINASVESLIDGWFGLGKKAEQMERMLADFLGVNGSILTNSGSSANLLAIASLMSPLSPYRLRAGDEIITSASGFPTTINPLFFYSLIPVFIDPNPETYNIEVKNMEKGLSKKTRAVLIAHSQGNPHEMDKIINFCRKNKLLLIEDNCDSLGAKYDGKKTGSFGLLSTQSFYPPHHITMGEGGAVNFNDLRFQRIIKSLRDWGRACWCRGDEKRTLGACRARFNFKIDNKPYDHKYIFNQIGFNLKPIEPQAAMGVEQFKKFPDFIKKRAKNYDRLYSYARNWEKYFILPKSYPKAKPCWFAFILTIRDKVKFTRHEIITYLEEKMIQTRPFYAGNITKQPAYSSSLYKKVGDLKNADHILHNTFFIGIYPGLGNDEIDYMAAVINDFLKKK